VRLLRCVTTASAGDRAVRRVDDVPGDWGLMAAVRLLEGLDARIFKEEWDPSPAAFGILDFNDLGMAHVHAEERTAMEEVAG